MAEQMSSSAVVITLRLIRDFASRNVRFLVLKEVDLDMNTAQFFDYVRQQIEMRSKADAPNALPKPFRNFRFDAMKIEYQAFGSKTNDPLIRLDNEDQVLMPCDGKSLRECGVKNETEISVFDRQAYLKYKDEKNE